MTTRLWVVSAPNESSRSSFSSIKSALQNNHSLCSAYHFRLPTFRVGTLDSLIAVADAISRDDKALEAIVDRILRQFRDLCANATPIPNVDGLPISEYVTDFEWDEAKFASSDSLADIREAIMQQVGRLEDDMKIRLNDYSTTKQALSSIERRSQGTLMTKSLATIIQRQHVVDTEHMVTLFLVLPAYNEPEFLACYEQLAAFVVPRSVKKIATDGEYALFGVTVFKKCAEEFKAACRERRYTIRDFTYDASAIIQSAEEEERLKDEAAEQLITFTKWTETAFAETFIAMVHLKALRAFAESVLRYGLPVNFDVALLVPRPKTEPRLRAALNEMFGHLGGSWAAAHPDSEDVTNIPGIVGDKHFYPYVFFELPLPQHKISRV